MKKFIIIIPYFGTLPPTFPFWLQSAKDNPDVDFLLVTDQEVEGCSNIHVMKQSLDALRERFCKALGMEVSLPKPYKLCDFKPAYGYVFADEIQGYDFWGFGDVDLVYGRIRDFITDAVLDRYDMISGWGHLTLYRNNEFCNTFFMQRHENCHYYKDVYTTPENRLFDEYYRGCSEAWEAFYPDRVYHCESSFDDVRIQSKCRHFKSEFAQERKCLTFMYKDRNLYRIYYDKNYRRHVEPTLYAHFQKRYNWKIKTDDCSDYIIYPDVFRKPFRFMQSIMLTWFGRSRTAHLI